MSLCVVEVTLKVLQPVLELDGPLLSADASAAPIMQSEITSCPNDMMEKLDMVEPRLPAAEPKLNRIEGFHKSALPSNISSSIFARFVTCVIVVL
jgi:hypothetical protein